MMFSDRLSGIDRQTELNDDDGSLTGLRQTISGNEDSFFNAPTETAECWSNIGPNNDPVKACQPPDASKPAVTAKTSPYDYVTTVIYHPPMSVDNGGKKEAIWSVDCTSPNCYGVPLFRQYLTGVNTGSVSSDNTREWAKWYETITKNGDKVKDDCSKDPNSKGCRWPFIRMAGTATATRETMTVNGGEYYIDTTIPRDMQRDEDFNGGGAAKSLRVCPRTSRLNA
jgi:cell migration-inducing and hyaluronan-binding protein